MSYMVSKLVRMGYICLGELEMKEVMAINSPYLSSDIWNGWVLSVDKNGEILNSDIYCHDQVNTALSMVL